MVCILVDLKLFAFLVGWERHHMNYSCKKPEEKRTPSPSDKCSGFRNPGRVRGFRRFVRRPADAAKLPQFSGHLFPRERAMDRFPEDWPLRFLHFCHTSHIGGNSGCRRVPCSSISRDVWRAHIALDGTQYVRSRKAITIRSRENCPIPRDTTGEYGKIYCDGVGGGPFFGTSF